MTETQLFLLMLTAISLLSLSPLLIYYLIRYLTHADSIFALARAERERRAEAEIVRVEAERIARFHSDLLRALGKSGSIGERIYRHVKDEEQAEKSKPRMLGLADAVTNAMYAGATENLNFVAKVPAPHKARTRKR